MPPTNQERRRVLADAAIELLATTGAHGLTHRAVEKAANLPQGTASNYFRDRETLLLAAAERVVELHLEDMDRADHPEAGFVELVTDSLFTAATALRTRYLAIFELQLEAGRRPALASALARLQGVSTRFTTGYHAELGLAIPPERVPTLMVMYGGALFVLVTAPPGSVTREAVEGLVQAMVHGALPEAELRDRSPE